MSSTIQSNRQTAAVAPKRPPVSKPAPERDAKPTMAGDRLSLSSPQAQLERLKTQLEGPLPPIPAAATGPDWKSNDAANRQALIKTLRGDAAVMAGLAAWKTLPDELRLKLGDRVSNIQASLYGFKPASLHLEDGPYRGGFNPGNGGTITIGPKSMVSANEFLNTVVHEQAHAMQWQKSDQAMMKKLPSDDPYTGIAQTWLKNFYNYTPPSEGYRAYREQPTEAHAHATGDQVAAAVLSKR